MSTTSRCLRLFLAASFILVATAFAAASSANANQKRRATSGANTTQTCARAHTRLTRSATRRHASHSHLRTIGTRRTRLAFCVVRTPTKSSPQKPTKTAPVSDPTPRDSTPTPPVSNPTPPVSNPTPPVSNPTPPASNPTPGTRGSTPFFDGTFSSPNEWPSIYGSCDQALNNVEIQFTITSSCDPADDGHYRTDLCSASGCHGNGSIADGDVYQAGQATCTSVPVDVNDVTPIPGDSWMMFAEEKDSSASNAAWAFMLNSYYTGTNQFQISFVTGTNNTTWDGTATPGWHTLSICTNNANDSSGEVYGIYEDGVRLTFNHGIDSGSQSITNYPIINNGMSSWPLDIDDYTGGSVATDTITTGAPLVSSGYTNPPTPADGWNNA
jgi:hypothetical protein